MASVSVGDKFVIEVEKAYQDDKGHLLYKMKGFNTLVFDEIGISKLKEKNLDGYYEYKVISLQDISGLFNRNSGRVNTEAMMQTLNDLGIDGWHLVTAYSNELGKNALSGGAGGFIMGTNSTVDENILIFERFVKL